MRRFFKFFKSSLSNVLYLNKIQRIKLKIRIIHAGAGKLPKTGKH